MAAGRVVDRLRRINPTGVFLAVLAAVLLGLLLPGVPGGLILLGLAGALAALMRLTWSVTTPRTRVLRLVMLVAVVVAGLAKLAG